MATDIGTDTNGQLSIDRETTVHGKGHHVCSYKRLACPPSLATAS
jgi:hypothetical protein